jgi:tRNA-(ms[2]io[6]A)-hydroxylase
MIERSCERFKVLSENIKDPELAKFYRDLMISKQDIIPFLGFAKKAHGCRQTLEGMD